ncbi:DNA-binding response regulator [Planotetraspora phitsanulokensis]|uniref:DNA-binding response regulator n=1 Tax=Planotetraspora phitsanulokensis TaxID=575192 RepID=A0A8J3UFN1_9ACTN|nr:DNA-binding response regulator [Planotetraspora phitsanulokensis]
MSVLRVVLADDQVMIRSGLRALLTAEPGLEVVAEAGDGQQALAAARAHRPDVIVMDIRMPVLDGLAATRAIAADPELSDVRVLVLTTFDEDALVFEAIRAGAAGFLLKDAEPAELLRGIRVTAAGDALLSPQAARRLVTAFAAAPTPAGPVARALELLTSREREVVALVARGLSNEEIADRLVISPATSRTHVSRAMIKLAARDRAQLVVFAYESGLVHPGRTS